MSKAPQDESPPDGSDVAETSKPLPAVAWIGTGIMGAPMAGHLLAAGHPLVVHSRTRAKAAALVDAGARWAGSAAEAVAAVGAEGFVGINVGLPDELEAAFFGAGGVLEALVPGQVVIDFGTSRPSASRRIAGAAEARGAAALDAPVSGGDVGARNAALSIMVGGAPEAVARARPLLERLGKTIVHQGPAGSGQRTKIVNQILVAANTVAMCEAIHFARTAGLDAEKVLASVGGGAAASWSISVLAPRVLKGDFEPGFLVEHLVKDLRLAREEGAELGELLPIVDLCLARYERLSEAGHGRRGTQGMYLLYRDRLGSSSRVSRAP